MTEKAKAVADLESPVFEGTDVPMMAFVEWMMDGGRVSTFLAAHPDVSAQQISDYLCIAMPEDYRPACDL